MTTHFADDAIITLITKLEAERDEYRAALELAKEAMGYAWDSARCTAAFTLIHEADTAIKDALAKYPREDEVEQARRTT